MMKDFIIIDSPEEIIHTAEATFGNMIMIGNNLIIPFLNLDVMKVEIFPFELNGRYIQNSYLLFKGTSGVVLDYDLSLAMKNLKRECYGGESVLDGKYYEYWISFEEAYLIMNKDFDSSPHMYKLDQCSKDFLNDCLRTNEVALSFMNYASDTPHT